MMNRFYTFFSYITRSSLDLSDNYQLGPFERFREFISTIIGNTPVHINGHCALMEQQFCSFLENVYSFHVLMMTEVRYS
jgi:hypothetical protein